MNVKINTHSSILIEEAGLKFYFDPFKITEKKKDADFIFITHDHFDHFDKKSILNIKNENTYIICPNTIVEKVAGVMSGYDRIYVLKAGKTIVHYDEKQKPIFSVETVASYNVGKKFHKKDAGYLGYILKVNDLSYYVAGDTDITEEAKNVKCDIALIPIGGTYTMDYKEAAELINIIKPKIAIPTHYGSIVGTSDMAEKFKELVETEIEVDCI